MRTRLLGRLQKIEDKLNPDGGLVVFNVRYGHEEQDFEKKHKEHLANGGSPNGLFVELVNYASWGEGVSQKHG